MRVMIILKSDDNIEAGAIPDTKILTEMGNFNEELVNAGVMLAGEGLHPSSRGARVRFSNGTPAVIDGPFGEAKELIAGFWIWKVDSMQDAIDWAKRIPSPPTGEFEVEIRPVFENEDFGDQLTPELREQEDRLRAKAAAQQ